MASGFGVQPQARWQTCEKQDFERPRLLLGVQGKWPGPSQPRDTPY